MYSVYIYVCAYMNYVSLKKIYIQKVLILLTANYQQKFIFILETK